MATITLPTTADVATMTGPALVETFNRLALKAGQNPVKKFTTRTVGIGRLTVVVQELRAKDVAKAKAKPQKVNGA